MRKRKWDLFALVILCVISLTSCKKIELPQDVKKEQLVIWAWDESFNIKAVREAKEVFLKSHPNVEIEVVTMAQDDVISKLDTNLANGDYTGLPNIVLIEDYRVQEYLTKYTEEFVDLSDIADADDFVAYKTSVNQVDGKLYGIPFDSGVAALFYRTDMIEAAGYTVEDMENLTWDKYIEIGKAVKEKTGAYMLTLNPNELSHIRMMLQSTGNWYQSADGNLDIKDNQSLKDAIFTYQQLFNSGITKLASDWDQYASALNEGEAASVVIGYWLAPVIMEAEEQSGKWAVTAFPRMAQNPNSVNASSIGGGGWYVLESVGNTQLAKEFLKETFASNTELINTLADEIRLLTTLKAAEHVENYTKGIEFYGGQVVAGKLFAWQNEVPKVSYGQDTYKIEAILTDAIQRILEGNDMDTVLEEYHLKIEEELE